MIGELFKLRAGTADILQVPYRGAGPVMTDLVGGQIPMGVMAVTGNVLEFHRSGKLRILAVTKPTPLSAAPDVPTVAQAGFPDLTSESSYGVLAPSGTPPAIAAQIAQASRTVLAADEYQRSLREVGYEPVIDSGPEEFRRALSNDIQFWAPVVNTLALKVD
jgi:tripartite-type tricarboxylate transporter receptor subunit TctC